MSRVGFCTLIALVSAIGITPALGADQPAATHTPGALQFESQALQQVAQHRLEALDLLAIRQEDAKREAQGMAPRYAIPVPVTITPDTDGTWENVDNNTLMWRLRIRAPGALSINLGFGRYLMPPAGHLMIYSSDYSYIVRPFTDADNEDHGELWTPVVLSDEVVVELTIPQSARDQFQLELNHVGHGYRGFGEGRAERSAMSGACNVDVVCPEGDDWRGDISTVAVISTGGGTFCTGFMVNNTAYDLTPYFMTANHCGINAGNAASLVTYWNYENSWCRPPGSNESGQPGDGTLNEFNTGSMHLVSYSSSDVTLVVLDDDPNPEWQVGFAGWDRSSSDSDWAVAIHHPNTDEKRISFEDAPTTTTSYLGDSPPGDGTHVRVEDWDLGTTEPGSSGSPLFNQDHRVVGQLHGGYAACGNDDPDWYGRFSVSWDSGGIGTWLDAGGTGDTVVDTISGAGLVITPGGTVLHFGRVGGPFTNETVIYTINNPTPTDIDYEIYLTASFGILLDGATDPITGTLTALGGTRDITVTLGPDIHNLGAGVYLETINFDDLTNETTKAREHIVEVGQTLVSVDPESDFVAGGPIGGPFIATEDYTVTSERPTPVNVEVVASDTWISLNGGSGPVVLEFTDTGEFDTITVGFSAEANGLDAGIYDGTVTFTNLAGGGGSTARNVTLEVGRLAYASEDTPLPINDNETTQSFIDVVDDLCIGDVNVEIDISHTYIGDLTVDLTSPAGTTVRLHNRSGGGANDLVVTYDDEGNPPDGPGTLSDFDLERSAGTWTLTVHDHAGADQGTLNSWTLKIAVLGDDCPTPELIYSYPLDSDPGWTTEDMWAYGRPTGGGGEHGGPDPTTGSTGPYVYGFNLNGDYTNSMPEYHLTSTAIDCTGLTNTRMKFWRWLNVEQPSYDHAYVRVSTNGTDWVTVWENASEITDSSWSLQSIDISTMADNQETVYLRWTMGVTDGSWLYSGWNLDDVEIWGVVEGGCDADLDGSGSVDFGDILAILAAWDNAGGAEDLDGSGTVDFGDLLVVLAEWGPC